MSFSRLDSDGSCSLPQNAHGCGDATSVRTAVLTPPLALCEVMLQLHSLADPASFTGRMGELFWVSPKPKL